jgi:signal transduction histidine kinase
MNFLEYVKDKRFFIAFYIVIMSFVSLIMFVSSTQQNTFNTILYTNSSCLLVASLYLIIGYFYRRKFFHELKSLIDNRQDEWVAAMPESQNHQQKLFVEIFKTLHKEHTLQLQRFYDEKRDQQEFIMSWIHEVKLPIAGSRLLIENIEGKTVDRLIDTFEDELDKIDHYVEQALYYSRADSFSKDYFITEINVNQIIKNSIKKYAKLFINKGIRLEMTDNVQVVQSDSKWLGYVIDQIIANALKYTDDGGKISIEFEEDQKEKMVLIQDTGIGIKEEDIHRVFEKGFTGSTGRSHAKSTGMGLYLAKQLAIKLGHTISIESEEGKFTKVVVHFPKVRSYHHL